MKNKFYKHNTVKFLDGTFGESWTMKDFSDGEKLRLQCLPTWKKNRAIERNETSPANPFWELRSKNIWFLVKWKQGALRLEWGRFNICRNTSISNYELSPKKKNQTKPKLASLLIVKCTENQLGNFIRNLRRVPILLVHSQHFISRNYFT